MNHIILWSPITRIIHWAIAIPVLFNFFIEGGDLSHKVLGYVSFFAIFIRIAWGLISKDKAHFRFLPLKPSEIREYILILFSGRMKNFPGHNPLASVAYVIIWILVGLLGISGFMMGLDAFWGEDWLEQLHELLSSALMALVILHFIGIAFDGIKNKRKTWLGMITGRRE